MKRIHITIFSLILCIIGWACGSNENKSNSDSTDDYTQSPVYKKGVQLIATNDCLTCHTVDKAVTGPSYKDVAQKYPNDDASVDLLAEKIVKGGKGNWGQIPMTPHPQLSLDDAKAMVQYIFLFKK